MSHFVRRSKAFEVTSLVKPGTESQLVVRVVKHSHAAGIPKPVKLIASPPR